jgi:peroxiredoxin
MASTAHFPSAIGTYAPDFEIPGVDKEVHHLARYLRIHKLVCVVFLSNTCATVRSQLSKLKAIQQKFPEVKVIGINSNDSHRSAAEGFEPMQEFAQQMQLNFPYLWDSTQDVALGFQAKYTPQAFLIDSQGLVRYDGSINGLDSGLSYGLDSRLEKDTGAIATLLAGGEITPIHTPEAEVLGSPITWH